jgi:NTP pyrophosphatase (non-canonical NTP hydrolase)
MHLNQYQDQAISTAIYPLEHSVVYPVIGLANESGEVLGKLKKVLRGDKSVEDIREALGAELGDCLWYLAVAAYDLGYTLDTLAQANLDKLADRKARKVLRGDGDKR